MQTVWWLVWKNILIKKRGWTSLITELLIPLAFVGLLAYLYDLSEGNEFPAKTFLISSNQVFSPRLLPWELQRSNQKIGLIGDDDTIESFLATADLEYPGFSIETALGVSLDDNSTLHALTTPKFSEVCERFDSNSQLEEHIQKQGYGHIHTIQMIFSAISFSKGAPHWDYSIRTNGTNQQYRAGEHTEDRRRGSNAGSIHAYLEVAQTASGLTKVQGDNDDDELDEEDVSLKDGWAPGFLTLQHLVDNYIVGHNAWAPPTTGPGRRLPGGPPQDTAKSIVDELTVAFDGYASKVGSELMTLMAVLNTTEGAALLPSMKEGISNFTRAESTQKISRPLIQQFPTGEFTQGRFYAMLGALFAFFWIIFTMFPVSHLIKQVVSERESKIEEGMRMMGVKAFTLQLSWMLTFGAIFVLLVIGTVIISTSTFFQCSSPSMIFLFFLLWFVAVLCMSYLFSVFFSRAKTASTLSKILFLASYAPYASVTGDTVSTSTKVLGCLLAPISFAFGLDVIVEYEGNDQCLLWESVAIAPTTDSLSMQTSLIMLAADSLIYLILGWYLGNVLPREYGSPRPWYFVFAPDFWRGVFGKKKTLPTRPSDIEMKEAKGEGSDAGDDDHSADIEEVNVEMKLQEQRGDCVSIKGIRREFSTPQGKLVAVNDVDLSMFQDQIFVLLGHNGAGKTTLINLLSGMIAPTSGDATVYGKSVVDDMEFIRDMIGVCPQHDVLFPELTVEEHLKLFMGMKGVTVKDQDKAVKEYIADVGLTEKTHTASKFLSGGQKRKLSVAIALCGDSKVIFLDEPTSGMDPYSRRSTWNSLLNKRSGRIMILTTHFMDEADMLGDRIAIMAHGKVRCCGSSMFLKQRFGVGYSLQCVKSAATTHDSDELLSETIRSHVEGAKMLSNVAAEVSYQLPLASSEAFPALFNELDSRGEELGLENYGISATSMEEVFIRVAREGDRDDQEEGKKMQTEMMERRESVSTLSVEDGGPKVRDAVDRANPLETTNVITVFCWHVWALLLKRFNYMRRDVKGMMFQIVIPLVFLTFALWMQSSNTWEDYPSFKLSTSHYNADIDDGKFKGMNYFPTNTTNDAGEALMAFTDGIDIQYISALDYLGDEPCKYEVTSKSIVTNALKEADPLWCVRDASCILMYWMGRIPAAMCPVNEHYVRSLGVSRYLLSTMGDTRTSRYGAAVIDGLDSSTYGYTLLVNTTGLHASAIYMNIMNDAILRDEKGEDFSITTRQHPLPFTAYLRSLISSGSAITAAMFTVLSLAFIPAYQVVFIIRERNTGAKHQQLVSGVTIPAYWISTWIWDMTIYIVPCAFSVLLIYLFDIKEFVDDEAFTATILLFALYGVASGPFSYALSFVFKGHASGQNFMLIQSFVMMILMIASFIMTQIESTCQEDRYLRYLYRLFPSFCLGSGLLQLSFLSLLGMFKQTCDVAHGADFEEIEIYEALDWDVMGAELMTLGCIAVGYLLIVILLDFLSSYSGVANWWSGIMLKIGWYKPAKEGKTPLIDEDILAESKRVHDEACKDDVVLRNLRKVFADGKVAVSDLSFGIPKGECLGYLGVNGAGKTTTLKMLTADIVPSAGTASLGGFDLLQQSQRIRLLLGYCPQANNLLDKLTTREHLELFARIKGVPASQLDDVVREKTREMGLEKYTDVLAGTMSGGNMRKLSVALAMIGSPPIVFLDEPSTGMDPVARRSMWNCISRIAIERQECSIVLTTHSMEECEALATKVGIIVGGRMRCWGTPQHLRFRYGSGYMCLLNLRDATEEETRGIVEKLEAIAPTGRMTSAELVPGLKVLGHEDWAAQISELGTGWSVHATINNTGCIESIAFADWILQETAAEQAIDFMKTSFEGTEVVERRGNYLRFTVPVDDRPLGQMFATIEGKKVELGIAEYSLSQTTLESIFNVFAAQQEQETGAVRGLLRSASTTDAPKSLLTEAVAREEAKEEAK